MEIEDLVPRGGPHADYYKATDAKHFSHGDAQTGSVFTDPKLTNLEDLLALAAEQRGGLDGDDRAELIAMGADENAFAEGFRYLAVATAGTVGIIPDSELDANLDLEVVRTKPGAPASLVLEVDDNPTTNVGVIILGPDPTNPENEIVMTAHPGLPVAPAASDEFGPLVGTQVTVADARNLVGRRRIWVQTRKRPAPGRDRTRKGPSIFQA